MTELVPTEEHPPFSVRRKELHAELERLRGVLGRLEKQAA